METSAINVSFGDDDDDDNIVLNSSSSCWRYSEEDGEAITSGQESVSDNNIIYGSNVVVKTENIEECESSPVQSSTSVTVSVGSVSRIKDKSKVEREYAANAVKKVNDLLRNSELSTDECESSYNNDQNDENPLRLSPELQEEQPEYANNQTNNNPFRQEESPIRFFPSTNSSQPGVPSPSQYVPTPSQYVPLPSQYVPPPSQYVPPPSQYVPPPSQYVESSSSTMSRVGSSSVAFTSNPDNQQIGEEQVIKLIHTSDATLPYMCSACNMHSSNLGVMKQHIADHKKGVIKCPLLGLSKNVFICPFGNCDFNSPNYARVLTHLNRFHGSVAQHLIKQITSASLPEAVESLNDPVSPLCQRESIWKEVALTKKPKGQLKLYACSECNFKDYDYKTVILHLQGHLNQNKKQKTG